MRLVIISGVSGSGKSVALHVLEDLVECVARGSTAWECVQRHELVQARFGSRSAPRA